MMITDIMMQVLNGYRAAPAPEMARGWKLGRGGADAQHDAATVDEGPPFVLVANDVDGQWDVYAKRFDVPLVSFSQRELACRYAWELAHARKDGLVLLREKRPSTHSRLS